MADDWKVMHTSSAQKLEDQYDKEVHIPMMKQPTTMKKKSIAIPPQVTASAKASHPVEYNIDSYPLMMLTTLMLQPIRQCQL